MMTLRFDDTVKNMAIRASDGDEVGHCVDLLFDERYWTARYLVVKTGGWLLGTKALIPIVSVESVDTDDGCINICLTKSEIENAPGIDADAPVSRQHEISIMDYYAYGYYWGLGGVWGVGGDPMLLRSPLDSPEETIPAKREGDPNLRSVEEIIGYQIDTLDDEIGAIKDCYVCPPTWYIKYLVVETGSWLSKRRVLLTPEVTSDVSWGERTVSGSLTRADLEAAPEFEPPLTEAFEAEVARHFEQVRHARDSAQG